MGYYKAFSFVSSPEANEGVVGAPEADTWDDPRVGERRDKGRTGFVLPFTFVYSEDEHRRLTCLYVQLAYLPIK